MRRNTDILKRYAPLLIIAIITLCGGYLRYHAFAFEGFWIDEAVSVQYARAILQHGYPLLPNGAVSWDYFPTHYLIAAGMALFKHVHVGARFFSVIAGILLIPGLYLLSKKIFRSQGQACLAAALAAFMTYEIAWSRQARLYSFLQLFGMLALFTFWKYLHSRAKPWLGAAILFLLLAAASHPAGYLFAGICALAWLLNLKGHQSVGAPQKNGIILLIAVFIAGIWVGSWPFMVGRSALMTAVLRMFRPSELNYSLMYGHFLLSQFGMLFPLAGLGMLLALKKDWRSTIPLVVGVLLYFYVISCRMILFAFRYTLPIMPLLILFAAHALWAPTQLLPAKGLRRRMAFAVSAVLVWGLAWVGVAVTVMPKREYRLGYTEPQPHWREAYAMIARRHKTLTAAGKDTVPLNVISTFPVLHDIYLGEQIGAKFYIPCSLTGYPGDIQQNPPYTRAQVVNRWADLKGFRGYIVLDDLGLRMIADPIIRQRLANRRPNAFIPGEFRIWIWIVGES